MAIQLLALAFSILLPAILEVAEQSSNKVWWIGFLGMQRRHVETPYWENWEKNKAFYERVTDRMAERLADQAEPKLKEALKGVGMGE